MAAKICLGGPILAGGSKFLLQASGGIQVINACIFNGSYIPDYSLYTLRQENLVSIARAYTAVNDD